MQAHTCTHMNFVSHRRQLNPSIQWQCWIYTALLTPARISNSSHSLSCFFTVSFGCDSLHSFTPKKCTLIRYLGAHSTWVSLTFACLVSQSSDGSSSGLYFKVVCRASDSGKKRLFFFQIREQIYLLTNTLKAMSPSRAKFRQLACSPV